MASATFLANKIRRQIKINGRPFVFKKTKKDKYNQNVSSDETIILNGVFHTTNVYIRTVEGDASRTITKPQPMILALFEDAKRILKDDRVMVGDNEHKVVEKNDVNNLGVAYDISLELIYTGGTNGKRTEI